MNTAQQITQTIPAGYMQNATGHLVPESQVREQDKLRDQIAYDLVEEAEELNARLKAFKNKALKDIADLVQISADKYGANLGGKKGNVTVTTYDGKYKVIRSHAERIAFTEEIEAAKALFDECLMNWSQGGNENMKVVVDRTFRTNSNGQIKTSQVLDLMRAEVDDPLWKKAIEALKDSMQSVGTAVYIRVYQRVGESEQYRQIPLDLASV